MQQLTPRGLQAWLEDRGRPAPLLLDVREPWEYDIAHIQGSTLVPLSRIPAWLAEADPQQEIVVICHHGVRSHHAGLFLEHHGFSRVTNLVGGIDAWSREVDPHLPLY
ncbi:rhodanese-like domain-containing protein [Thioalkalivibrio sulfidiphilus]|uniref:rhodanese-like domain-containing protein n=1 Tax=Thioalkalivibrio sulfidiphilus TaxID=1033854 RepID=UPI003B33F60F